MSNLPRRKTSAAATSIAGLSTDWWPPHALVNETQPRHFLRVKEVAAIEKNRMGQDLAGPFQIQLFELRPFRGHDQRVAALGHFVHVFDERDILEHGSRLFHGARVKDAQAGALLLKALAQFDGGREPHIISILFESQAE